MVSIDICKDEKSERVKKVLIGTTNPSKVKRFRILSLPLEGEGGPLAVDEVDFPHIDTKFFYGECEW